MAARRFLWVIAIIIMLVIAGAFIYRIFGLQIMRLSMVPSVTFAESKPAPAPDYASTGGWLAHPKLATDPARWAPEGYQAAPKPGAYLFYVTPTAYLDRASWNAPADDEKTNERLAVYLQTQASVFNGIAQVWAPRYREATFGAFLTDKKDGQAAIDFAYADVLRAFDAFVAAVPADRPILLAGHSQGSLHLLRLLRERVAGQPIAGRIVAAYIAGWPVSTTADIPALGLPACAEEGQPGCLLSWQSFAEPAETEQVVEVYDAVPGFTGATRKGTPMVCTNPLTGRGGDAPADANMGALIPESDMPKAKLAPGRVPARCDAQGFLLIGEPPADFDGYVLPGNNYHVYDYMMFWANLRADAEARLSGWLAAREPAAATEE
ncbi:DUF3089 domain-containing protein [Sphingoaurantiacus capsulatus]|uniref:DUF3089 domain-containing protein n=1 Tax=Sphingoaurantiacus capsulatus TaxID=1771310 RepID=A0ABV7XAI1_9SPHN